MRHITVLALCSIFAMSSFLPLHCMQMESLNEQLLRAIGNSDTQAIELLARGASVHATTKGGLTPLHYAVIYGSSKLIEILMERANINASDQLGRTPLHLAARFGKMDAVALLLAAGADIHLRDKEGNTPQQTAIGSGFLNIAKLLARIK